MKQKEGDWDKESCVKKSGWTSDRECSPFCWSLRNCFTVKNFFRQSTHSWQNTLQSSVCAWTEVSRRNWSRYWGGLMQNIDKRERGQWERCQQCPLIYIFIKKWLLVNLEGKVVNYWKKIKWCMIQMVHVIFTCLSVFGVPAVIEEKPKRISLT